MAARQLAAWVARECAEPLGDRIGYQVRFENRSSSKTRVLYQTYGVFLRRLLQHPLLAPDDIVILDEFHERSLEADTLLAWLTTLQRNNRPLPRLIVMSATLDVGALQSYLGDAPHLDIPGKLFPVTTTYQPPHPQESLDSQALRALQGLVGGGLEGSVLVFMPGMKEILDTVETLEGWCRGRGIAVHSLHGSMSLEDQCAVVERSSAGVVVTVCTNVAETSLTVPGIRAVIDSGYARVAGYDAQRDRNTLFRALISRHSAVQRTGRAGRLGAGQCVRLWSRATEQSMSETVVPDILRLELCTIVLQIAGLLHRSNSAPSGPHALCWLSAPDDALWTHALELLSDIGAIDNSDPAQLRLTRAGLELLDYPLHPLPAALLCRAPAGAPALVCAAMVALWESEQRGEGDLFEAALQLCDSKNPRHPSTSYLLFDQLVRLLPGKVSRTIPPDPEAREQLRAEVCRHWIGLLPRRLAVRQQESRTMLFADGKSAVAAEERKNPFLNDGSSTILLALTLSQSAGGRGARKSTIHWFLPLKAAWVEAALAARCRHQEQCVWDEQLQGVVVEQQLLCEGLVLQKKNTPLTDAHREQCTSLLAEKVAGGAVDLLDEQTLQFIYRVRLVAHNSPQYQLPPLDGDDLLLIYHEACEGRSSLKQLRGVSLLRHVQHYVGVAMLPLLDSLAPLRVALPAGRSARITYFASSAPELSARLGDFLGMQGRYHICEGKVECVYDILAPNFRTVQKTSDLSSFWTNTYPEVKKELKRRYPRHPWP
jgi:ATP-dependent helicase HrpB